MALSYHILPRLASENLVKFMLYIYLLFPFIQKSVLWGIISLLKSVLYYESDCGILETQQVIHKYSMILQ